MDITPNEKTQIERLQNSRSISKLSNSILRSLDEDTVSRLISAFLYLKARRHPDSDFAKFLGAKELMGTLTIGLNMMSAFIPAMIFDKEFRTLVMKLGTRSTVRTSEKS
jgi:hypothetical protein